MKYHPKPAPDAAPDILTDGSLFDVDTHVAGTDDLPGRLPEAPRSPSTMALRAQGLDPRTALLDSALAACALMSVLGYLFFQGLSFILPPAPAYWLAGVTSALGFLSALILLPRIRKVGNDRLYSRIYLFVFLSTGLALFELLPASVLGMVLAPFLAGYGLGSYGAILWAAILPRTATASKEVAA